MKKILYSVMALAIAAMTFTACEDVPAPYDTPNGGGGNGGGSLPYTSANLNTGWTLVEVTSGAQPWSKGNNYVQATGYQKWDGANDKSNKAVEGWLVSPAINTTGYENVKLSFNHTIRYTNNVTGWEANHKVYASTDFNGSTATWTELSFVPVASPYSDWTLYSSGEIQLPAGFVGQEKVYIGFLFKAPATASTTWELQNFKVEEGIAQNSENPEKPDNPTGEAKGSGTLEDPFNPLAATNAALKLASGETSTDSYYIKGKVAEIKYNYGEGKYPKSADYYISEDGKDNNKFYVYASKYLGNTDYTSGTVLALGDEVIIYGQLQNYNGTAETATNKSYLYSLNGKTEGGNEKPDTPSGDTKGTADSPYTVTDAIAAGSGTGVYIKAFIVGTVTDKSISSAEFSTNSASQTNILIAASADETNISNCMPVQLPTGDVRTKLNLKDNPGNYKKEVTLYGNIEKYFSVMGVKSVTYAILDGTDIGKKPEGGNNPGGSTPPSGEATLNVDFKTGVGNWTISDKTKPTEIDAIWKNNSKYGMVATGYSNNTNYDAESWLISPQFSLAGRTTATLKLHHAINFFSSVDVAKKQALVLASSDGTNWTELTLTGWPDKLSWTFVDATADLSAFAGKSNIQIAFKYISTAEKAGTWEVETITIE